MDFDDEDAGSVESFFSRLQSEPSSRNLNQIFEDDLRPMQSESRNLRYQPGGHRAQQSQSQSQSQSQHPEQSRSQLLQSQPHPEHSQPHPAPLTTPEVSSTEGCRAAVVGKTPSRWTVVFAKIVNIYDGFQPVERMGLALTMLGANEAATMILYKQKNQMISSTKLKPNGKPVHFQDNYVQYYDDRRRYWSLRFVDQADADEWIHAMTTNDWSLVWHPSGSEYDSDLQHTTTSEINGQRSQTDSELQSEQTEELQSEQTEELQSEELRGEQSEELPGVESEELRGEQSEELLGYQTEELPSNTSSRERWSQRKQQQLREQLRRQLMEQLDEQRVERIERYGHLHSEEQSREEFSERSQEQFSEESRVQSREGVSEESQKRSQERIRAQSQEQFRDQSRQRFCEQSRDELSAERREQQKIRNEEQRARELRDQILVFGDLDQEQRRERNREHLREQTREHRRDQTRERLREYSAERQQEPRLSHTCDRHRHSRDTEEHTCDRHRHSRNTEEYQRKAPPQPMPRSRHPAPTREEPRDRPCAYTDCLRHHFMGVSCEHMDRERLCDEHLDCQRRHQRRERIPDEDFDCQRRHPRQERIPEEDSDCQRRQPVREHISEDEDVIVTPVSMPIGSTTSETSLENQCSSSSTAVVQLPEERVETNCSRLLNKFVKTHLPPGAISEAHMQCILDAIQRVSLATNQGEEDAAQSQSSPQSQNQSQPQPQPKAEDPEDKVLQLEQTLLNAKIENRRLTKQVKERNANLMEFQRSSLALMEQLMISNEKLTTKNAQLMDTLVKVEKRENCTNCQRSAEEIVQLKSRITALQGALRESD